MKNIVLFAALFLLPDFAGAFNEPDSFMGVKFGRPIGESIPKCDSETPPYVSGRKLCWQESYGRILVQNVVIDELRLRLFVDLVNDAVAAMNMEFATPQYSRLAGILKTRYGAPSQVAAQNWTSRAGVSLPGQVMKWKGKKTSITIQERGGLDRLDRGEIALWIDTWESHVAKSDEERRNKAAKGL
jgi:hypothetical protein